MGAMARVDLLDQFEAVLPRMDSADEAGAILAVMARICRASSAAVYFERSGSLVWLAGNRLSDEMAAVIHRAWRAQRSRILTGIAFSEPGTPAGETLIASWLMWVRRPADGGLDAVYFAGPDLRSIDTCSVRMLRLATLLAGLH